MIMQSIAINLRLCFSVVCFLTFLSSHAAYGQQMEKGFSKEYSTVKIYFVNWDVMTRTVLFPKDVREAKQLYVEINDELMISKIHKAIYGTIFKDRNNTIPEPARLVVDFIGSDGIVNTVYANESHILTNDSSKYRLLDTETIKLISSLLYREGID
jgi:hypothetical protein